MTGHIIVHDTRLRGTLRLRPGTRVIRTECESLGIISRRIRSATRNWPAPTMTDATATEDAPASVLTLIGHGARVESGPVDWAMQVGIECIHKDNAQGFGSAIYGCVRDRIRVLCCNAAGSNDAREACSRLAQGAGVPVYAATSAQQFSRFGTESQIDGPMGGWINFGRWEGTVVRYGPNGSETIAFEGEPPPPASPNSHGPEVEDPYQISC